MHVAGYADELIEEVVKLYSTQSLNDTAEKKSGVGFANLSTTPKFPGKMSILESHMSHLGK